MTSPAILRACIHLSGLSTARYAADRLARSTRCVNYWLAGEKPIPARVLAFLERTPEYPHAMELLQTYAVTSDSPEASPPALPTP